MCGPQGTLISPNRIRSGNRMLLCRGATVYAASIAMPNIRRSLHNANLFAIAMASRKCVGRKAHLYLQIGTVMQQNVAMPRRYSICGKLSAAEYTRTFRHLNRDKIQETHCNSLRNFILRGFSKHLSWFRCNGKGKHLNPAARQNPAAKPLTTNTLQDFQQLHPRYRSQAGLEYRGMQIHPGSASGRGIHQTRNRTAHASEPEQNSKNLLQFIEKLFIAWFWQASPLVQMQR